MKKKYLIMLVILAALILLSSCAKADDVPELKDKTKLADIVTKINNEIGFTMPININDTTLTELFHINKDDVIDYSGVFSISSRSADSFIILKVNSDKKEIVTADLKQRKQDLIDKFKDSLPNEYDKANASKILEKGDYLIFICVGEDSDYTKAIKSAQKIVESYFD